MSVAVKVLVIDDDRSFAVTIQDFLQKEGFDSEAIFDAQGGLDRARSSDFDVVLTDLQMPNSLGLDSNTQGLRVIRELRLVKPHLPVILMTAHHTTNVAIEATKVGAYDYILKPIDPADLLHMVRNAAKNKHAASAPVVLGDPKPAKEAIVGRSRVMQEVYKEIGRMAATNLTVLIRGETGTGKELVARALYQHSARAGQPFIVVNCAALPETLLESELFGHEAGAFTDAKLRRIGRFEQAEGGTIFLDEIGDMKLGAQVKLLRVLQEKAIQRLGGKETIPVDVRILAATHRELESAIREGTFRSDLYFRIQDAVIRLPPLRERPEDIPEMAGYFLDRASAELGLPKSVLEVAALQKLREEAWPGNVRELRSTVRHALLVTRGGLVTGDAVAEVLTDIARFSGPKAGATRLSGGVHRALEQPFLARVTELLAKAQSGEAKRIEQTLVEEVERELYVQAIRLARGNQSKAARWLGVSRPTLHEKIAVFGLQHGSTQRQESQGDWAKPKLLVIEDEVSFAELLNGCLEAEGYQVEIAESVAKGLPRAESGEFDVVLTDLSLSGPSGLELIQQLKILAPHLPVILMTDHHDTDTVIQAIKLGAFDYFAKPDLLSVEPAHCRWEWVAQLSEMVDKAVTSKRVMEAVRLPGETFLVEREAGDHMLGRSRAMRDVYKEIGQLAATNMTVLIRGETGTGKELVARALYQHSSRVGKPFIVINCAALPETLLESELFGHEAGAFTDAKMRRIGRFEQAHEGTIFLDEIGDMSLSTQVKLLRVLQEKTIQRLGGTETITVDVRILAATHRELDAAIREGTFRSDLYFRLNEAVIGLPPLRERATDIPELADYFVRMDGRELCWPDSSLTDEAFDFLQHQPWPGNIRELRSVIRRAVLSARGYQVTSAHIRRALSPASAPVAGTPELIAGEISRLLAKARRGQVDQVEKVLRESLERELYRQAFDLAGGDQSQAARLLGVARNTMRDKIKKYGLNR